MVIYCTINVAVQSLSHICLLQPMDCSLPGSSVHGISEARILELPFLSPGDLPDPGVKQCLLHWQAGSLLLSHQGAPCSSNRKHIISNKVLSSIKERRNVFILSVFSVSLSPSFSPHICDHSHRHICLYNSSGKDVLKWHDLIRKTDQIQVALVVKNLLINAGDIRHWGSIPGSGWEDPLEEGLATHSSILAWRIPWAEESGRLQYMGSQRVRRGWSNWARMTKFQAECRTFSKSSKNKWFKLVLGLVFRSFPAFPTLSHDLLSILIADPDSALIQTILMTWAYSSKYGFLVLLFSFLYDSERYAHVST